MELRKPSAELRKAREVYAEQRRTRYPPDPVSSLDLSWTDLSGMDLDLNLTGCNLSHARCSGTTFGIFMVRCQAQGADFTEAFLKKAQIGDSVFDDAVLHRATLLKASVVDSTFRRADFAGANLNQAVFRRCDLRGARFTCTQLPQVGFDRSLLAGADFTGCTGWVDPDRVNVGTPEEPSWIEGEELRDWFRAAGASDVRVGYAARASG